MNLKTLFSNYHHLELDSDTLAFLVVWEFLSYELRKKDVNEVLEDLKCAARK